MTAGHADIEYSNYWKAPDSELVSVKCASLVLHVRLQAVVKLGLSCHLVEKRAYYLKSDIEAFLQADQVEPNQLLRDLQENHRQVQVKQQAHPSTRYRSVTGTLLPNESKVAKQASKGNRKKPLTKDEVFGGWRSSVSLNRPVKPAMPMTEFEVQSHEASRAYLREIMAEAEAYSLEERRARLKGI